MKIQGRAVIQGLRSWVAAPGAVAPDSLEREFTDLLREVTQASGAQTRMLVTGQPRALTPEIQQQIFLIGREALVNALHHSKATRIEAEVAYLPSHLRVMVRDNGCGIDAQIVRSGRASHWGLPGMCDRAKGIGAEVRIFSRREAGTEVEISLPCGIAAAASRGCYSGSLKERFLRKVKGVQSCVLILCPEAFSQLRTARSPGHTAQAQRAAGR